MENLGDWSDHDNKKYIGKIDRIYVSTSEFYEVEYFIDKYLSDNDYIINKENRNIITEFLEEYPGRPPYKRKDLINYLDNKIK